MLEGNEVLAVAAGERRSYSTGVCCDFMSVALMDFDPVFNLVARMKHDHVAFLEPLENLRLQPVLATDLHDCLMSRRRFFTRNTAGSVPTRNSALVGTFNTSRLRR